jgi:hypothetical protein
VAQFLLTSQAKETDMRFLVTVVTCLALAAWADARAQAQGPVREGLRRTGEVAAQGVRGAAQGTAAVARGVGQAAVDVGQAAANTVRGTARVTGNALGITPSIPYEARIDQSRNARWRFSRQNGEWWYYTPQNNWMYHRNGQWLSYEPNTFTPLNQGQFNQQQMAQGQAQIQGQAQLAPGQQYSAGFRGAAQAPTNQHAQPAAQPQGHQAANPQATQPQGQQGVQPQSGEAPAPAASTVPADASGEQGQSPPSPKEGRNEPNTGGTY